MEPVVIGQTLEVNVITFAVAEAALLDGAQHSLESDCQKRG